MGRTYPKNPSTTSRTPIQWTDQVAHKYCGKIDLGRIGRPNKAHRCDACLAIKHRESRYRDGPKNIKAGRLEKMAWLTGDAYQ
ncbi:hypothetical protein VTJ49DRAFT_775 [Mycothermus thermophilus]|uniref:Uncharacterized protein n=1 Tax=Humicola insolens TaxID=85995 RepID=A0ABR3VE50_HUMIN